MTSLNKTVTILRRGGLVGFPTESFWALGADATNAKAIKLIYTVKGRERKKPIALIAADLVQVKKFFHLAPVEILLARNYWPGALTLLLRPKRTIAAGALGAKKIGVRVPNHAGARGLAKKLGRPVTATSLNISGRPATKSVVAIKKTFFGLTLLTGRCGPSRHPSTVVEVQGNRIRTLRAGAVRV